MTYEQLKDGTEKILSKAKEDIRLLEKKYDLLQEVSCEVSTFDSFTLFKVETREELKEVLTKFGATDNMASNKLYGNNEDYNYPYQIGIDNGVREIIGRINYKSDTLGDVWVQLNVNLLDSLTSDTNRNVYDSEKHYFNGRTHEEISRIRVHSKTFGFNETVNYYGGDVKLKHEGKARDFIKSILNN